MVFPVAPQDIVPSGQDNNLWVGFTNASKIVGPINANALASQVNVHLVSGLNSNVPLPPPTPGSSPTSFVAGGNTAAAILGGIVPAMVPEPGQAFDIIFSGNHPITIRNLDTLSAPGNQIMTGTGGDVLLPPGQTPSARLVFNVGGWYQLQLSGVHSLTTAKLSDFGAPSVGDGVTDVTAAFNAALAYLVTQGGGTLELGMGTWVVSSTIVIPIGIRVKGPHSSTCLVELASSSVPQDIFQLGTTNPGNGEVYAANVIEGIQFYLAPFNGEAVWAASSSAFTVGQYVRPALPSNIVLKCLSGSGPTGAHTPLGQMVPGGNGIQLLGQVPTDATADILIKCITPGNLGTFQYQYSLDGGGTYSATQNTTVGQTNSFVLPGTGYTLLLTVQVAALLATNTYAPFPPVWITGTPNAEWLSGHNTAIDVAIIAGGHLGAGSMTFQVSAVSNDKQGSFQPWDSTTYPTTAGTSYAWTGTGGDFTAATGLTIHFGSGRYTATAGGANYTSAQFGFSMVVGTVVTDDGYTWQILPGCSCIHDLGTVSSKVSECVLSGGNFGLILNQSEGFTCEKTSFGAQAGAGIWEVNGGDDVPGRGGGFTNNIHVSDSNSIASGVYGIVDDGGIGHFIIGGNNFEGNPAGWLRGTNILGLAVIGNYFEDSPGVLRDTYCFSRGASATAFSGFSFEGNYAASQPVVLDLYTGQGLAVLGNCFGTTTPFTSVAFVGNAFQAGNACTVAVFDFNGIVFASGGTTGCSVGGVVNCETLTAAMTVDLPVMLNFQTATVSDYDANCNANNITVTPPAAWSLQDPNTLLYGTPGASILMTVNGSSATWRSDGGLHKRLTLM